MKIKSMIHTKLALIFCIIFFGVTYLLADESSFVNAKDGLVLRAEPNRQSNKITLIPYKEKVKVIKYSDQTDEIEKIRSKWAYVQYGTKKGWVFGGYLSLNEINENPSDSDQGKLTDLTISNNSMKTLSEETSLKSALLNWLYFNTCHKGKNRDYKGMYFLLSSEYLKKSFPKVKSDNDFIKEMELDETYYLKFLSIDEIIRTNSNEVKIKLSFLSGNEGVTQKMEKIILFTKEKDGWKYKGIEPNSLKVIN